MTVTGVYSYMTVPGNKGQWSQENTNIRWWGRAGEMTKRRRAEVVLTEDLGSVSSTHTVTQSHLIPSVPKDRSDIIFWPPQARGMPVVHKHNTGKTPTLIKN